MLIAELTRKGGGERYCLELARGLGERGWKVSIYTNTVNPMECYPELMAQVRVVAVGRSPLRTPFHRGNQLLDALWLGIRVPRRGECLTLNPHGWPAQWAAMVAKIRLRAPVVWACNDYMFNDRVGREAGPLKRLRLSTVKWLDRLLTRSVDIVVVLSDYAHRQISQGYRCSPLVIRAVFPYMVARRCNRVPPVPGEPWHIVGLNILMPHRGVADIVEALAIIRDSGHDVRYTHIGGSDSPEYQKSVSRLIKERRLDTSVHFAGIVSDDARLKILSSADVFVFTPAEQTYSLAVLETIGFGIPTVVASGSGIAELLDHGNTGLTYPRGNSVALALVLTTLLTDPVQHAWLTSAASRLFEQHPWEHTLDAWEGAFEAAINGVGAS